MGFMMATKSSQQLLEFCITFGKKLFVWEEIDQAEVRPLVSKPQFCEEKNSGPGEAITTTTATTTTTTTETKSLEQPATESVKDTSSAEAVITDDMTGSAITTTTATVPETIVEPTGTALTENASVPEKVQDERTTTTETGIDTTDTSNTEELRSSETKRNSLDTPPETGLKEECMSTLTHYLFIFCSYEEEAKFDEQNCEGPCDSGGR